MPPSAITLPVTRRPRRFVQLPVYT